MRLVAILATALAILSGSCGGDTSGAGAQPPQAASAEPAGTEFLHGRVVDRRSGQGVPGLEVEFERRGVRQLALSDERGDFHLDTTVEAGKWRVSVRLAVGGEPVPAQPLRVDHDPARSAETSHVLHVDVGPTYALRFSAAAQRDPERWEARLVERSGAGVDRAWSWRTLLPGALPRLRYPALEHAPDPSFHARVELRLRGGDWFGRAPVASTSQVAEQEVTLRIVQYAAFGGVVVDVEGRAVPRAEVLLRQELGDVLPAYSAAWRRESTDEEGAFRFDQTLEPGRYHVRVLAEGREPTDFDIMIEEGGLVGYELRVASLAALHDLRGRLTSCSSDLPPTVVLSLVSLDGRVERVLHPLQGQATVRSARFEPLAEGGLEFAFENLPGGEYELALFALDGVRYEPATVSLTLPCEALEITCSAGVPRERIAFDVLAAGAGPPIDHYHAIFRSEGWWNPEGHRLSSGAPIAALPRDSAVTWMVHTHGYRPAYGDLSVFSDATAPGGLRRARVALEPGWGAELWFKDAGPRGVPTGEDTYSEMARARARAGVAGVRALADGRVVGTSDERGLLRLSMEARPELLTFQKAGWSALETDSYARGQLIDSPPEELRSAVIWMAER